MVEIKTIHYPNRWNQSTKLDFLFFLWNSNKVLMVICHTKDQMIHMLLGSNCLSCELDMMGVH